MGKPEDSDRPCGGLGNPHTWAMPHTGDSELSCEVCDYRLGFDYQTDSMRLSIVDDYKKRRGSEPAEVFRLKLDEAAKAWGESK